RIGGEPGTAAPPPASEASPPEPATQAAADEAMASADEGVRDAPPEPASPPARAPAGNGHGGDGHAFVSPVVARIAAEHGIDPSTVQGTGTGGRVMKKDILAFVESEATTQAPPEQPQPAPAETIPEPTPAAPPSQLPQAIGEGELGEGVQVEPMNAMRRGIAEHMRRSLDTAAHVTSAIEVDMS